VARRLPRGQGAALGARVRKAVRGYLKVWSTIRRTTWSAPSSRRFSLASGVGHEPARTSTRRPTDISRSGSRQGHRGLDGGGADVSRTGGLLERNRERQVKRGQRQDAVLRC